MTIIDCWMGSPVPEGEQKRTESIPLIDWQGRCLSRLSLQQISASHVPSEHPTNPKNTTCMRIRCFKDKTSKSNDHTTVTGRRILSFVRQKVDRVMIDLIHHGQPALCDYSHDNQGDKEIWYNVLISPQTGGLGCFTCIFSLNSEKRIRFIYSMRMY